MAAATPLPIALKEGPRLAVSRSPASHIKIFAVYALCQDGILDDAWMAKSVKLLNSMVEFHQAAFRG